MLEEFKISHQEFFPVCVMATMSSGKSTLINAILGEEVLPEKNEACTNRAVIILDNKASVFPKAYLIKKNGEKGWVELTHRTVMEKINADEEILHILIEMNIPKLYPVSRPILLIDTPGVNNSQDIRHGERTQQILKKLDTGVIVYLMNVTQLATNDDALLLQAVAKQVEQYPKLKVCFVLNKIDMLDEDKESVAEMMRAAEEYIADFGFHDAVIYPLSAVSAKLLRLKLNGKKMTKSELRRMEEAYQEYRATEKNMLQYSGIYHQFDHSFFIGDLEVSEYELKRAIENTGITGIERQISDAILEAERRELVQLIDREAFKEWEGIYAKKRKAKNIKNYSGPVRWICRACRQINGENNVCLNCGEKNVEWRMKQG